MARTKKAKKAPAKRKPKQRAREVVAKRAAPKPDTIAVPVQSEEAPPRGVVLQEVPPNSLLTVLRERDTESVRVNRMKEDEKDSPPRGLKGALSTVPTERPELGRPSRTGLGMGIDNPTLPGFGGSLTGKLKGPLG